MKRSKSLRRRYGRAWASESAISVPAGGGLYDVVLVDSKGGLLRAIAKRVPYAKAQGIIQRVHA